MAWYLIDGPGTFSCLTPEARHNPKLKKLCASKLENGGQQVCIGNDQTDLNADLSKLVDGSFLIATICYQDSNTPTVCGADGGLFSSTSDGCPSNACPTADE